MNLLIDIGNTRVKYVKEIDGQLNATQYALIPDFLAILKGISNVDKIRLVSVSNETVVTEIEHWAIENQIDCDRVNSAKHEFGVQNSYSNFKQMGCDRWLAIVAADSLYCQETILIVDSGTATTFDIVHNKQHIGGWIIPGLDLMMQSLFNNTDKVHGDVGNVANTDFATNTSDNVNHGCWAATIGAIDVALSKAERSGYKINKIVFTGGNGKQLQQNIAHASEFKEQLLFIGLQRYL